MKLLVIHPDFPGQFQHLVAHLARDEAWTVVGVGDAANSGSYRPPPGLRLIHYPSPSPPPPGVHPDAFKLDAGVRRGRAAARVALDLRDGGFFPDVILVHPGWGDALYLKEVFPNARILAYCEYHYRPRGSDVGFDPEFPPTLNDLFRVRSKNAVGMLSLEASDWGMSPTHWQRDQHPEAYRSRISVVFDGIDTGVVRPDPRAEVRLGRDGLRLTRNDEVVTFVNRSLEPYRGFHSFMRALPELQRRRPRLHALIVGGDDVSYGLPPGDGRCWREALLAEVGHRLDFDRIHFLGRLPYQSYLKVLQVSSVHVYLTYPFILGWSMMEAMAAGCAVVGSRTPPVQEMIDDGVTGYLADFLSPDAIADTVCRVLEHPDRRREVGARARELIVSRYDLNRVCLPQQIALLRQVASGHMPDPV